MDKKTLKIIIIITTFIILYTLFFISIRLFNNNSPKKTKVTFKYMEVNNDENNPKYKKPKFNNEEVNKKIDKYLNDNSCEKLNYNVYELDNGKVNVYLNCGNPYSFIYNDNNMDFEDIELYIKNDETFKSSVKNLLNLKYPSFITEEIDIFNGNYNIKSNEIIAYYKTKNYGNASIKINYNEVKDNLKYKVIYDDLYENEVYKYDPKKKLIAFSFDDGPSGYDLEIIDTLVDSHSKATFFLVGNRINSFKDSINKMEETKMEVGNHSYDHRVMTKLSNSKILDEINKTNKLYKDISGKDMKLLRPPYGAVNKRVLNLANMPSILWSIDTLDWKYRNADKVYESIINNARDGDIVLMHSLYKSTSDAVKKVIPELYKKGFQIVSVGELFELKGKSIIPGNNYTSVR